MYHTITAACNPSNQELLSALIADAPEWDRIACAENALFNEIRVTALRNSNMKLYFEMQPFGTPEYDALVVAVVRERTKSRVELQWKQNLAKLAVEYAQLDDIKALVGVGGVDLNSVLRYAASHGREDVVAYACAAGATAFDDARHAALAFGHAAIAAHLST